MISKSRVAACAAAVVAVAGLAAAEPTLVRVTLPTAPGLYSGRLLIFAEPAVGGPPVKAVAPRFDAPEAVAIAGQDIHDAAPGATVEVDADLSAFPKAFSALPPGPYHIQAVLDVHRHYAYAGPEAADWVGPVADITLPAGGLARLDHQLPAESDWPAAPPAASAAQAAEWASARADTTEIDFASPALSAFWGRPIHMRGWVVVPPTYAAHAEERFPTVYYTHGFGGRLRYLAHTAIEVHAAMAKGEMPPMIWVLLDESGPTGTHEFADSVNNGPWGQALTAELIPDLERRWRMDGRPSGRFLNGHSSGGWATLWLQTRYPKLFGGTWSTSPDPSDFHDFTGIDLYAANANVYRRPDGAAYPLVRDHGKVLESFSQYARSEAVEGEVGGQIASFDWVFSPRGADGRPEPMFDRVTGTVDPQVVAYWREHFDIAYRVARDWPVLRPDLDGKIHLIVGTADTFYLDGAAHRLKAALDGVGAKSDFRFLPDRTHFDLYKVGDNPHGLLNKIAWEMYAVARPEAFTKLATGH
ncbi:MAG TPA: alpha/beta hydrolase-fold protein [Caulobacteraceae bacterium]